MAAQQKTGDKKNWFSLLDKLFWLLWILLPVMFAYLVVALLDNTVISEMQGTAGEKAACAATVPNPANYSTTGKFLFWTGIAYVFSFYAILMFLLHRMIHRFAKGHMFVDDTLRSMHQLGVVLIGFSLIQSLVSMISSFGLQATDNVPVFYYNFIPDPAPLAVGLFLLAIKYVLKNAMALKTENELTI
jgi:hypothetical protein